MSYAVKDGTCIYDTTIIDFTKWDNEVKTYAEDQQVHLYFIHPKYNCFFEVLINFTENHQSMHQFLIIYKSLQDSYLMDFKEEVSSALKLLYLPLPIDVEIIVSE